MDGLLILAIETATPCGSVSLTRGGEDAAVVLAESSSRPDITHSRRLLGTVDWVMRSAGVSWEDLAGVAVSLGPGSFTGLRIGMAAAKAIVLATGLPLVGVPTLDALALAGAGCKELICCLLDARKQEVYAAFYRADLNGLPRALGSPVVISPADLLEAVQEPVMLIGSGARVYREMFVESDQVTFMADAFAQPRAVHVGLLGCELLAAGKVMDPVHAAPMYVRASEAEINLARKKRLQ